MKTRVNRTRTRTGALLLAGMIAAGSIVAPGYARENMSVGQAGDPTDGLDADSSGSSTTPAGQTGTLTVEAPDTTSQVILIPVSVAGVLIFRIVVVPIALNLRS